MLGRWRIGQVDAGELSSNDPHDVVVVRVWLCSGQGLGQCVNHVLGHVVRDCCVVKKPVHRRSSGLRWLCVVFPLRGGHPLRDSHIFAFFCVLRPAYLGPGCCVWCVCCCCFCCWWSWWLQKRLDPIHKVQHQGLIEPQVLRESSSKRRHRGRYRPYCCSAWLSCTGCMSGN